MSLIKAPTAVALGGRKDQRHYSVSFQYQWFGDVIAAQNLGGVAFNGSVYSFDILATKSSANFPAMRTLQLAETFIWDGGSDRPDGELIIYVPGSGQLIRLGSPTPDSAATAGFVSLSALLPIIGNAPTQIQFGKAVDPTTGIMQGQLIASMVDFELPPYSIAGGANVI